MRRTERKVRTSAVLVVAGSSLLGCGGGSGQDGAATGSTDGIGSDGTTPLDTPVCAFCQPQSGGETTDFDGGGTPDACSAVSTRREIDVADGAALGLDLQDALLRMQRPIDAPLFFEAPNYGSEVQAGDPLPSVYPDQTRILATITPGAMVVFELDSELCDGTVCRTADGELEVDATTCKTRVEIEFDADVDTADGTFRALGHGTTHYWLREDEAEGPDFLAGSTWTDLAEVTGTLSFETPTGDSSSRGTLYLDFYFEPEQTVGDLRFEITRSGTPRYPLGGSWPEARVPPADDGMTGPEAAE